MICLPRALPFHSRNNKKSNSRRQIVFNEILVSRLLKSSESKRERENWGGRENPGLSPVRNGKHVRMYKLISK